MDAVGHMTECDHLTNSIGHVTEHRRDRHHTSVASHVTCVAEVHHTADANRVTPNVGHMTADGSHTRADESYMKADVGHMTADDDSNSSC